MAVTIAKLAPLLTPRIDGSASGLRVIACIIAPATASAAADAERDDGPGQAQRADYGLFV